MNTIRKTFAGGFAAFALAAGIAATTTPAEAQWRGHRGYHHHGGGWRGPALAAGVIGGLAVGALAAQAGPRYHAYPAYGYGYGHGYAPVYPACYNQRRAAYDPWGNFAGYRVVRICR